MRIRTWGISILCLLLLLSGCGSTPADGSTGSGAASPAGSAGTSAAASPAGGEDPVSSSASGSGAVSGTTQPADVSDPAGSDSITITCRIVEEEDGSLLLADQTSDTLYELTLSSSLSVTFQDPREDDLESGMLVDMTCEGENTAVENGAVQVNRPKSLVVHADGFDNLCSLYLDVLEDLWEEDRALRSDISIIGVDLSRTRLSGSEQSGVACAFSREVHMELVEGTWQELADQGFINGEELYWEDGVFFSIEESAESLQTEQVQFEAQIWRSGLGADFFTDCTASPDRDGRWEDYAIGGYAMA